MTGATETADNVTTIRGKQRSRKSAQSRVESMLERLSDILRTHVESVLPSLLDESDDRLFELAERASTNQLQTQYFDAMRTVRVARRDISKRFLRELEKSVSKRLEAADGVDGSSASGEFSGLDSGVFKLVEEDEFEESVAVKNISSKLRNLCQDELFALDRRVAFLLADPSIEGEDNPFAPECLANAANAALHEVAVSLEIRLMLLKLVDRHLVKSAQAAYHEMNQFLVANDVLSDIRPSASTPRQGPNPRAQASQHRGESTQGKWVQAAASQMDAAQPQTQAGTAMPAGVAGHSGQAGIVGPAVGVPGAGGVGMPSAPGAQVVPSGPRGEQVMAMLGDILSLSSARSMNHPMSAPEASELLGGFTELQREQVGGTEASNLLRDLRQTPAAANLSHNDGLLIDVVAMMFDYVLDDDNIVDSVRTLVSRLQIPVLKVAILDKTFFARRAHPARKFVNTLAELGARMGSSVGAGDPLFDRIDALVQRLLKEFESDLEVFPRALEELEEIAGEELEVAEDNAWHESKVAEERARLDLCREQAGEEIATRVESEQPPAALTTFLHDHWRHLLANTLYQHGGESKEWRAAVQTMDNLIWSATPKTAPEEKDRLLAMLPFLLQRLKAGMDELCLPKAVRDAFLKSLSRFHIEAVRTADEEAPPESAADDEPMTAASAQPEDESAAPTASADDEAASPSAEAVARSTEPELEHTPTDRVRETLETSVVNANRLVYETAESRIQCRGMGTTVVALKFDAARAVYAHVGDSRLYRLRDGAFDQLTKDHTYRQQMLDRGLCDASNAHKIAGNLITRAVGSEDNVLVDVDSTELAVGDVFVLCSDGLSDMIDDERIEGLTRERLSAGDALKAVCKALVDAANEAGGRDNVTVAMARVDAVPSGSIGRSVDHSSLVTMSAATDCGRVRPHNEDCVKYSAKLGLIVLADGMGGCNAGEVASAMTVKVMMDHHADLRMPALEKAPAEQANAQSDTTVEFDFQAINATFWDDGLPDDERKKFYEAVAEEVESITLNGIDALEDAFNIGEETDDGGIGQPIQNTLTDPFLNRILSLNEGSWVEFRSGEGRTRSTRASLTWVASDKSRYLFTGRLGQKVVDSTPHGLALELRNERMRILDAVPLFDRAINNLSGRLRGAEPGLAEA